MDKRKYYVLKEYDRNNTLIPLQNLLDYKDIQKQINTIPKKNIIYSNVYIIKNFEITKSLKKMFLHEVLTGRNLKFSIDNNQLLINGLGLRGAYMEDVITLRELKDIQNHIETKFKEDIDYNKKTYPLFKDSNDIATISEMYKKIYPFFDVYETIGYFLSLFYKC
jgi:hypothetical protein